MAVLLLLAGCSMPSSMDPVDWWHQLEGGDIAQQRPPPPNADAPYPNLATVPGKPVPIPPATRNQIASGLIADRANAQYAASLAPLPAAPSTTPREPTPPPQPPSDMNASLPAASAPPPRPAPLAKVQAEALAAPPSQANPAPAPADSGPMPVVPAAPPPPPAINGESIAAVTVPTPPPRTPPPAAPVLPPPGMPMAVPFAAGSAVLGLAEQAPLKQLAASRAGRALNVVGYGDATSTDPAAQSAALTLAWRRAQAISGFLQTAGVPPASLRVTAEATGSGGVAGIAP